MTKENRGKVVQEKEKRRRGREIGMYNNYFNRIIK